MAIINIFKKRQRKSAETINLEDEGSWVLLGGNQTGLKGLSTQIRAAYKVNPYAYRAIDLIASACASVKPKAYDKDGEEITEGPIVDLLRRPNDRESWRKLIYEAVTNYKLNGNAFLYLMRTGEKKVRLPNGRESTEGGITARIYSIRPYHVEPAKTQNLLDPIDHWNILLGDERQMTIAPRDMIHIHTYCDDRDVLGISPLSPAYLSIEQQTSARKWNTSLLEKGGKPSMQINIPEELTDEEFNRLERQANGKYNGVDNIGRTMILDHGKTASMLGMTAQELDFNAGLIQNAREIEIALGVPSELLNDNANKTYASTEEAVKIFYNETVIPILTDIYEDLTHAIAQEFGIDRIGFDISQIEALKGDQTALISALTAADYLSTNEKRNMLNYGTVEGGDTILVGMGKVPISEVNEPPDNIA